MISEQCRLFLLSILYGFGAWSGYDLLRLWRRIVPHSLFFIHMEDLLFWAGTALLFYYEALYQAAGVLRAYYFLGGLLGVIVCEGTVSPILLKYAVLAAKKAGERWGKVWEKCKSTEKKFEKSSKPH